MKVGKSLTRYETGSKRQGIEQRSRGKDEMCKHSKIHTDPEVYPANDGPSEDTQDGAPSVCPPCFIQRSLPCGQQIWTFGQERIRILIRAGLVFTTV
ncbi:hypothetical protein PoB_002786500 [Plakobranchus ocellatus]|uniref:Uncharacterized protein n=1 Tax=Plakobranchus ocellatus TaxID=259542 RepID=A0AAV3ZZR6_9GAST|nr:hypothetical protein PoB_002786500 [Plakobranchus ocellatus]